MSSTEIDSARAYIRTLSDAETKEAAFDGFLETADTSEDVDALISCVRDPTFWSECKTRTSTHMLEDEVDNPVVDIGRDESEYKKLFFEVSGGASTIPLSTFVHLAHSLGDLEPMASVPSKVAESGVVTPRYFTRWMREGLDLDSLDEVRQRPSFLENFAVPTSGEVTREKIAATKTRMMYGSSSAVSDAATPRSESAPSPAGCGSAAVTPRMVPVNTSAMSSPSSEHHHTGHVVSVVTPGFGNAVSSVSSSQNGGSSNMLLGSSTNGEVGRRSRHSSMSVPHFMRDTKSASAQRKKQ